jgi:type IV secretion system protein VirB3
MESERERQGDPLYLGPTRPAMIKGITLDYAYGAMAFAGFITIAFHSPLAGLASLPGLYVLGRYLFWRDPRFLEILIVKWKHFMRCRNRAYWGCNSYEPW